MSKFLQSLQQEYNDLKRKLQKVTELLTEYGEPTDNNYRSLASKPSHLNATEEIADDNPDLPDQSLNSLEKNISTTVDNSIQLSQAVNTSEISKPIIINSSPVSTAPLGFEYPIHGAWKDKIFYALRISGKPSKSMEIAAFMQKFEPIETAHNVVSTVRQYCSNLGKTGHLGVQSVGKANLYFLKS